MIRSAPSARTGAFSILGGLLLSLVAQGTPPLRQGSSDETPAPSRRSLEDLLREVEVERARRTAALAPEVARLIEEIDDLKVTVGGPTSRAKQRQLEGLGLDALPLLVPYIDPGKAGGRSLVFRAGIVAELLREQPSVTVTDDLLRMAREGSFLGRLNALSALETTVEPQRAVDTLIMIAGGDGIAGLPADETAAVRDAGFRAIAALTHPKARSFLAESLASGDVARAGAALRALQAAPTEASGDRVLELLRSDAGPALAESVLPYYAAHEALLADDEHARAVGAIAAAEITPSNTRVALFDLLRITDAKVGVQVKRLIEPYSEAAREDVRRAALLLLGRMNDRTARKTLLSDLDDKVREGRSPIDSHTERARVHYEIGDWTAAVKDWRVVMKTMAEERVNSRRKEPYIGIARALARLKKYREAADYLESAPISLQELRVLGTERDFLEMASSRYRETFHLD